MLVETLSDRARCAICNFCTGTIALTIADYMGRDRKTFSWISEGLVEQTARITTNLHLQLLSPDGLISSAANYLHDTNSFDNAAVGLYVLTAVTASFGIYNTLRTLFVDNR